MPVAVILKYYQKPFDLFLFWSKMRSQLNFGPSFNATVAAHGKTFCMLIEKLISQFLFFLCLLLPTANIYEDKSVPGFWLYEFWMSIPAVHFIFCLKYLLALWWEKLIYKEIAISNISFDFIPNVKFFPLEKFENCLLAASNKMYWFIGFFLILHANGRYELFIATFWRQFTHITNSIQC